MKYDMNLVEVFAEIMRCAPPGRAILAEGDCFSMKSILLIGLGRFGRHIASELNELGHQVMAVDCREDRVKAIMPYVTNAMVGSGTNAAFLASLGVRNYDVCIVAIGNDFQSSLETTSLLKDLGAKMVVARAARDVQARFLLRNGADEVVYPEKQMAKWTAIRYSSNHLLDYIELDSSHAMYEVPVPAAWVGRTLRELDVRSNWNVNVIGIRGGGQLALSHIGDHPMQPDETLLVMGLNRDVQKCFDL